MNKDLELLFDKQHQYEADRQALRRQAFQEMTQALWHNQNSTNKQESEIRIFVADNEKRYPKIC